MQRYIVKDRRAEVTLSVQHETEAGGTVTSTGRFPVSKRILELTDAEFELYREAVDVLEAEGVLLQPKEG